ATGNISITAGGTIWSNSTGIIATNNGTGNITVITNPGMDINTAFGDGSDACASSTALCLDPYGIHATAVGTGTVTVITDDDVNNIGPGAGIFTETQS